MAVPEKYGYVLVGSGGGGAGELCFTQPYRCPGLKLVHNSTGGFRGGQWSISSLQREREWRGFCLQEDFVGLKLCLYLP